MDIRQTLGTLLRDGFILVFNQDKLDVVKTARALIKAGIGNMEVTCRIRRPLEKIKRLKSELPDFAVGAASLIDFPEVLALYNRSHGDDPLPSVEEVVASGADYVVSAANFRPETFRRYRGTLPIIPGCATVTEILAQFSLGANFCKVFPAKEVGGPAYVAAIDPAIHKTISLVPTGGTTGANIPDYFAAGVLVVGGSFSQIDKQSMAQIVGGQDYDLLASELRKIKDLIDAARARQWPGIDFKTASFDQIGRATGRNFNI